MNDTTYDGSSKRWGDLDGRSQMHARYLEMVNEVLRQHKQESMDSLRLSPGMSVLEVGCGLGLDAEALAKRVGAKGRVVGLDASHDLIAKARERTASLGLPLEFKVGDAHALEFPDGSFDAARVDRVLQHLRDPALALREMTRVVRSGGRIAALEPNWEGVSLDSTDRAIGRAVVRHRADVSIANGMIGSELRRLLVELGCSDVIAQQGCMTFGSLDFADRVMSLRGGLDGAVREGWVEAGAAESWWTELQELDKAGKFFAVMSGVFASATVA